MVISNRTPLSMRSSSSLASILHSEYDHLVGAKLGEIDFVDIDVYELVLSSTFKLVEARMPCPTTRRQEVNFEEKEDGGGEKKMKNKRRRKKHRCQISSHQGRMVVGDEAGRVRKSGVKGPI